MIKSTDKIRDYVLGGCIGDAALEDAGDYHKYTFYLSDGMVLTITIKGTVQTNLFVPKTLIRNEEPNSV